MVLEVTCGVADLEARERKKRVGLKKKQRPEVNVGEKGVSVCVFLIPTKRSLKEK